MTPLKFKPGCVRTHKGLNQNVVFAVCEVLCHCRR